MNVMVIGAHPDDPEVMAAGMVLKLRARGHRVLLLSMTDGSAGHQELPREALARRRAAEAQEAAALLDVSYRIMPFEDGALEPSPANRNALLRVMRGFAPDLVLTHPMMDYHPDHRYTCQLVMDTSFLLNVPAVVPDTPIPRKPSAFLFAVRQPRAGAFAYSIDDVWERKIAALHCHASQMYEWLPWIDGVPPPPADPEERYRWLSKRRRVGGRAVAEAFRTQVGPDTRCAEAFAPAPVGRPVSVGEWQELTATLAPSAQPGKRSPDASALQEGIP